MSLNKVYKKDSLFKNGIMDNDMKNHFRVIIGNYILSLYDPTLENTHVAENTILKMVEPYTTNVPDVTWFNSPIDAFNEIGYSKNILPIKLFNSVKKSVYTDFQNEFYLQIMKHDLKEGVVLLEKILKQSLQCYSDEHDIYLNDALYHPITAIGLFSIYSFLTLNGYIKLEKNLIDMFSNYKRLQWTCFAVYTIPGKICIVKKPTVGISIQSLRFNN